LRQRGRGLIPPLGRADHEGSPGWTMRRRRGSAACGFEEHVAFSGRRAALTGGIIPIASATRAGARAALSP
jgi:hypothetical protein